MFIEYKEPCRTTSFFITSWITDNDKREYSSWNPENVPLDKFKDAYKDYAFCYTDINIYCEFSSCNLYVDNGARNFILLNII